MPKAKKIRLNNAASCSNSKIYNFFPSHRSNNDSDCSTKQRNSSHSELSQSESSSVNDADPTTTLPSIDQDDSADTPLSDIPTFDLPVVSKQKKDWTQSTWMETRFTEDRTFLSDAEKFFSVPRSHDELMSFCKDIPEDARWIHAVLPSFQRYRNQKAVFFLLLCPKRDQSIELEPVDKNLFTAHLVRPIGSLITDVTGMPVVYANFRKQCRRDKKDLNCLTITQTEITIFNIATRIELLIAKNVFNITFTHTIAWSKQLAGIGSGLDALLDWKPDHLLGTVYRIHSHPRWFKMPGVGVDVGKVCFRATVLELICPAVGAIIKQPPNIVLDSLMTLYANSPCPSLAPLVYGTSASVLSVTSDQQQLLYPTDPNWFSTNRLMLASWALMGRMPWAAGLVRDGRLPDYYLTLPRGLAQDAVGWIPTTDYSSVPAALTNNTLSLNRVHANTDEGSKSSQSIGPSCLPILPTPVYDTLSTNTTHANTDGTNESTQSITSNQSTITLSIDPITGLPDITALWRTEDGDF